MKIKPIFAWYDLWIGLFWDTKRRAIYALPLPMVGFVVYFWTKRCYVLRGGGAVASDGKVFREGSAGSFVAVGGGWTKNVFEAERFKIDEARAIKYMTRPHGKNALSLHHVKDFLP